MWKADCVLAALRLSEWPFFCGAERWAAVNKARSVLKEQPLYQATSQHRVSTQPSWMVKGLSVFPLQIKMVKEAVGQERSMCESSFRRNMEVNKCPSFKWFARITLRKGIFVFCDLQVAALITNVVKLNSLTLPLSLCFLSSLSFYTKEPCRIGTSFTL